MEIFLLLDGLLPRLSEFRPPWFEISVPYRSLAVQPGSIQGTQFLCSTYIEALQGSYLRRDCGLTHFASAFAFNEASRWSRTLMRHQTLHTDLWVDTHLPNNSAKVIFSGKLLRAY